MFEQADRWVGALADADDCACQVVATCIDERAAEATAHAADALLDFFRRLIPPKPDANAELKAWAQVFSGLVTNCHVDREGRSVVLRSTGFGKIADVITTLFPAGGL
jgi:hypothetical protein